jgi:ribose transport system substrate-binding protein
MLRGNCPRRAEFFLISSAAKDRGWNRLANPAIGNGFKKAIEGKLVIGAHLNALQNTPEAFTAITENLITSNPGLKALFTVNDNAAEAAAAAIETSGRKDVWIVSVDGIPSVVKTIAQDGLIKATVGQQPGGNG